MAQKLFAKTKFQVTYYIGIADQVVWNIRKNDEQLFSVISQFTIEALYGLLLKSTINFCLHQTDSCFLSQIYTVVYIESTASEQAFYIQSLLSTSCRVLYPHLFKIEEKDEIYRFKY